MSNSKRTLATIRKDQEGRSIVVFDGYVKEIILKDGTKVNLQDKRTFFLNDSVDRAQFLLDNNYMSKEIYEKEMQFIEKNQVLSHLVVPVIKGGLS